MLEQVDACLESLLRASVPLSATDVDVSFETPTRDWSARLNRPTVNLFLWDVKRSSELARTGTERFERNGVGMERLAAPILDLRYMIAVWTQDHRDERALLSGVLRSVLRAQQIPDSFLTPELADEGVNMRLASSADPQVDAYKIIDNTMKATLDVSVSIAFDLDAAEELAAAVTDIGVRIEDRNEPERRQVVRRVAGETSRDAAGVLVVSPRGSAVVDATGRFLVRAAAGDQLVVHADPPRTVVVPEIGGVIVR